MPDNEKEYPRVTIDGKLAMRILNTLISSTRMKGFNLMEVHETAVRLTATMEDRGYTFTRE